MRDCLSDEELELPLGEDDPDGTSRDHLARCGECRSRLETSRRDQELFEELRRIERAAPRGVPSIPGYRIEGELSRGGQGVVYRAVQEATSRAVALKVLAESGSARERRRFEREVELIARLRHPGIVTVHDSGVAGLRPWYAMELVEGARLHEHVARAQLTLAERLALFLRLCEAVAHAHRSGVIHRDLKPENVLVDAEGRVRVLDFGTALPVEDWTRRARVTSPGEFLGTRAYASPEQVGGRPAEVDTRSDVYSLGVLLYELVTGRLPHDVSRGLSEVVVNIATAAPADPARFVPRLDRDLRTVLLHALEKDPERRYPSVETLARDVAHALAHEPIEARPRSALYVLRKSLVRHRRGVLAAAAVVVLSGALLFAFAREHLRAERQRENSELVRAVIQDILSAAAPQRMGGDVKLLDVIELASTNIEAALANAPDAQAAVELTIGDTYRRLLMNDEAETHLRRARALLQAREHEPQEHGPDEPEPGQRDGRS